MELLLRMASLLLVLKPRNSVGSMLLHMTKGLMLRLYVEWKLLRVVVVMLLLLKLLLLLLKLKLLLLPQTTLDSSTTPSLTHHLLDSPHQTHISGATNRRYIRIDAPRCTLTC